MSEAPALSPYALAAIGTLLALTLPLFWMGVCLLLSRISGWHRLALAYPLRATPQGQRLPAQSGAVGPVSYRNSLDLQVSAAGLCLSVPVFFRVGHSPLFIPWQALHDVRLRKFLWHEAMECQVGQPTITRLRLPPRVFELRSKLGEKSTHASTGPAGANH